MGVNLKELEKKFHADGYQLGMKAVLAGGRGEAIQNAVQEMHRMVDDLIMYFSEYAGRQKHAPHCRSGCAWCCYQPVFALSYELDYLDDYLKKNYLSEKRKSIYARAAAKRNKLEGLKEDALLNSKYPCPLLEENSCLAYAARPVACRIYLSSDVSTCIKFHVEPEKTDAVPALLEFPMRMGRLVNEGFRAALKAGGVQTAEFRIEEFNDRRGL